MSQVSPQSVAAAAGQLGDMQLGSSSSDPVAGMKARVNCFTEQAPDATIQFQIIDLGLQVYIWVAVGGAKLQNMFLAIQSKQVCCRLAAGLLSSCRVACSLVDARMINTGDSVMCINLIRPSSVCASPSEGAVRH